LEKKQIKRNVNGEEDQDGSVISLILFHTGEQPLARKHS